MIKLAPLALLVLAALVPLCTGTIWGNLLLVLIVCGIFFGTVSLGQSSTPKGERVLVDNKS